VHAVPLRLYSEPTTHVTHVLPDIYIDNVPIDKFITGQEQLFHTLEYVAYGSRHTHVPLKYVDYGEHGRQIPDTYKTYDGCVQLHVFPILQVILTLIHVHPVLALLETEKLTHGVHMLPSI
jgi:hypothetical protein